MGEDNPRNAVRVVRLASLAAKAAQITTAALGTPAQRANAAELAAQSRMLELIAQHRTQIDSLARKQGPRRVYIVSDAGVRHEAAEQHRASVLRRVSATRLNSPARAELVDWLARFEAPLPAGSVRVLVLVGTGGILIDLDVPSTAKASSGAADDGRA